MLHKISRSLSQGRRSRSGFIPANPADRFLRCLLSAAQRLLQETAPPCWTGGTIAQDADLMCYSVPGAFRNATEGFTLSVPSARQDRDSFPGSRQVLKKDLLAVRLRHFHSGSGFVPIQRKHTRRQQHAQNGAKINEGRQSSFLLSLCPLCARSPFRIHSRFA